MPPVTPRTMRFPASIGRRRSGLGLGGSVAFRGGGLAVDGFVALGLRGALPRLSGLTLLLLVQRLVTPWNRRMARAS